MKLPALFGLFFLLTASLAPAQEGIAVVDFESLILAHPKAETLKTTLMKQGENAASVVIAKSEQLKRLKEEADIYQAKGLAFLEQGERLRFEKVQQEALRIQNELLELDKKTRTEMSQIRLEGRTEIAKEVQALIKTVNNGRFAVVLDLSFISTEGFPQVLDYPGATDITEEVKEKLPKE